MNLKLLLPLLLVVVIVMGTLAFALPNINAFEESYKITVSGTVNTVYLTVGGLELSNVRYDVSRQKLLSLDPNALWFWQTGEITIRCALKTGTSVAHTSSVSIGRMDKWASQGFTTDLTHVLPGTYTLAIDLLEDQALKDTYTTEVVIG